MIWVRPDEAAVWLETSTANVHVLAHRRGWRRQGKGKTLRYALDDVDNEKARREDDLTRHPL